MSKVDAAQSSKALACMTLLPGAMTWTSQVINSTSSHHLEVVAYVILLGSFVSSGLVSASLCNSVW